MPADAASRIYKTVDKHGNVVFTDVPPAEDKQAAEVQLGAGNSFKSDDARVTAPAPDSEPAPAGTDSAPMEARYSAAEIVSPANDEALRSNVGTVSVQVRVQPSLQPGHRLRLLVDDIPQMISPAGTTLSGINRGTHTLVLEVVDAGGPTLYRGAQSTFHLQRAIAGG